MFFIVITVNVRLASSLVTKFDESVAKIPMREAVRFTKKNMKWSASDMQKHAEAHANALIEYHLQAGDSIAVWLDDSAEKVGVLYFDSLFI